MDPPKYRLTATASLPLSSKSTPNLPISSYHEPSYPQQPADTNDPQGKRQPSLYWGGIPPPPPLASGSIKPTQQSNFDNAKSQRPTESDEIIIAVMGATGTGKSTFINLVSQSGLAVGRGLTSCTSKVEAGNTFNYLNRSITLVDTPGFDDTNFSDIEILKRIALYLSTTYKIGRMLSGLIYIHRIRDTRVGGKARSNISMFRKLCGDETLRNVAIVTNMWEDVTPELGAAREEELGNDAFFGHFINRGATMLRHDNTLQSAQAILRHFMGIRPKALRIQQELVDEGRDITRTGAGEELDRELAEMARKHAARLAEMQQEMQEALAAKDTQTRRELEEEQQVLVKDMAKTKADRDHLSREYQEGQKRVEAQMREMGAALEEERRARIARQKEIDQLKQMIEENHRVAGEQLAEWGARLRKLQHQQNQESGGLFRRVGRWIDAFLHDRSLKAKREMQERERAARGYGASAETWNADVKGALPVSRPINAPFTKTARDEDEYTLVSDLSYDSRDTAKYYVPEV